MQRLTRQKIPGTRHMNGVTLVEMLIVTAVMAILLALAIPSFNATMRDNRVLSSSNSLAAAISQTRSEAVKRGRMVSICPSAPPYTTCAGNDWARGWIIYLEKISVVTGGAPDIDTSDPLLPNGIISVGDAMTNVEVTKTAGNGNAYIRFSPRGLSEEALALQLKPANTSGSSSSTCLPGKADFQELQVGLVGRTSIIKKPC